MKRKRDKNKKNQSASRNKREKVRKKDIKIRSQNPNIRKRSKKRMKALKRKYMKRRAGLVLALIFIIFLSAKTLIRKINKYDKYTYPKFRQEVMDSITKEIYVGNTEDRSLTSAEKISDFNKLSYYISRNYALDKENEKNYKILIDQTETFKKKVKKSKSDQEFFDIVSSYLSILDDNRTHLLDVKTYNSIFPYYKEHKNSPRGKILGDAQVVNRYKRLFERKDKLLGLDIKENNKILELNIPNFNSNNIKEDKEKIRQVLKNNQNISYIFINLSQNESIDDKYANEILPLLIYKDYNFEKVVFYRGNLLKQSLSYMKNNKDKTTTSSSFIENQAIKFPEDTKEINKENYMYYDQIKTEIKKDQNMPNKKIYVLTNDNTKNEAIRFANILKNTSDATVIKNSFEGDNTRNDIIYYLRSDIIKLDHSGLLISINSSKSLNEDDKYLKYDQIINAKDPYKKVLSMIK
ncbi:hypothetical protein [Anaerococcus ihuae]|uniref:hypothetical protein n=1 Tax=Anaerococcus ihuae TaxID=2899519 RepID=UPI001F1A11FB|nr:hypothetical protein [Anaerococcus ihuae]